MSVSWIAGVGDRDERYETHRGIDRVLSSLPDGLDGTWHATDAIDPDDVAEAAGVWIAPGSPYRDRDAVLAVIRRARETGQPILGSCGGFQHMVLEFARAVAGIDRAEHGEEHPCARRRGSRSSSSPTTRSTSGRCSSRR